MKKLPALALIFFETFAMHNSTDNNPCGMDPEYWERYQIDLQNWGTGRINVNPVADWRMKNFLEDPFSAEGWLDNKPLIYSFLEEEEIYEKLSDDSFAKKFLESTNFHKEIGGKCLTAYKFDTKFGSAFYSWADKLYGSGKVRPTSFLIMQTSLSHSIYRCLK